MYVYGSNLMKSVLYDNRTRGSQEPVIARLFSIWHLKLIEMGVLHIILKVGHSKIISTQISEQKILLRFLSHNIPKWNKLAVKI